MAAQNPKPASCSAARRHCSDRAAAFAPASAFSASPSVDAEGDPAPSWSSLSCKLLSTPALPPPKKDAIPGPAVAFAFLCDFAGLLFGPANGTVVDGVERLPSTSASVAAGAFCAAFSSADAVATVVAAPVGSSSG